MKIGAIGIRTKMIVGDAATWYLVKKYVDRKVGGRIEDVPEELKKYVRVLDSWVDVTEDLESISNKVDKVANHSLVPDTEIDKLAKYPELENLQIVHANLTDKNSEAAFQHVDTTVTKETLDEADKVALYDSVTGAVVLTPKSNLGDSVEKLAITKQGFNGELSPVVYPVDRQRTVIGYKLGSNATDFSVTINSVNYTKADVTNVVVPVNTEITINDVTIAVGKDTGNVVLILK